MTSERDCTETRENVSTSATSDVAAQAWDKSMWQGNAKCGNENELTHVDMGYNDIYNSNRGKHELGAGNRGLQTAENTINRTVDQLLDGNYDTNKIIKQLQGTDTGLSETTGDYKDAIKHLGASSSRENLDDLLDGRRDVMKADDKVGKAIEQLKNGDEAGAIKSLLQSLGKIDKAQDEFGDFKTGEEPRRRPHHGNLRDRDDDRNEHNRDDRSRDDHGRDDYNGRTRDEDAVGDRRDNRLFSGNDGRMHDHMYRDNRDNSNDFNPLDPAGFFNRDFNPLDPAGFFTNNGSDSSNDYGRTDRGMWGSSDLNPSRITIPSPLGGSRTIDLNQISRAGDQIHRVADPLGLLPSPSELRDPGKVIKHVLDPFDIF